MNIKEKIVEENNVINIEDKFKWYAIYCASNQEKSTKVNIERELRIHSLSSWVSKIEVPTDKVIITVKGKKITREKIILPCYIFINADVSNGELLPILRRAKGVLGFINPSNGRTSNLPEPLKNSEVDKFLKVSKNEEVIEKINFIIGERVRITDGAFATFEGNIDKIDNNKKTLKVIVKIFSRETPVEVEYSQVDKINN